VAPAAAVEDLPGFAEGVFRVQDTSAQRAVSLLPLRPGDRVLDACAAPGGKTFLLSEQANVDIWAVDASARRLARLEKEWTRIRHRFGHARIFPVVADLSQALWPEGLPTLYDHVVLDAPCSGSGVVRRHPESAWVRSEAAVDALVALQSALLDRLWRVLRPGGQLLYITCSVFPQEGEEQILSFLARTPDAVRKPAPGQILPYYLDDGFLCVSGDGFFYARLEKRLT
jgi:16S rRNA (cytosine967-C5)-methyltransferase